MSTYPQALSDAEIAQYYLGMNNVAPGESPVDIEERVAAYLQRHGLHRSAFLVAVQVVKLAKAAPVPAPETAAQVNVRGGFGDQRLDVSQMSMTEWARVRQQQFGMGRNNDLVA